MKHFHDKFYPDSVAAKTNNYFGVNIKEIDYEKSAEMVGGFHIRVIEPKELNSAMKAAVKALASKKMVLMNIIIPD
jgi:thiamine pyrophosphate-dependent acetolactate synthase large subunit-like protein